MGDVLRLPVALSAARAWRDYAALVRRAERDRRLWTDPEHCRAMARAHRIWCDAFARDDGPRGTRADAPR